MFFICSHLLISPVAVSTSVKKVVCELYVVKFSLLGLICLLLSQLSFFPLMNIIMKVETCFQKDWDRKLSI